MAGKNGRGRQLTLRDAGVDMPSVVLEITAMFETDDLAIIPVALMRKSWLLNLPRRGKSAKDRKTGEETGPREPDLVAALVLAEVVFWYRRAKDGRTRFRGHRFEGTYAHFESELGLTWWQAKEAIDRLAALGLVITEWRNFKGKDHRSNVLFLEPVPDGLRALDAGGTVWLNYALDALESTDRVADGERWHDYHAQLCVEFDRAHHPRSQPGIPGTPSPVTAGDTPNPSPAATHDPSPVTADHGPRSQPGIPGTPSPVTAGDMTLDLPSSSSTAAASSPPRANQGATSARANGGQPAVLMQQACKEKGEGKASGSHRGTVPISADPQADSYVEYVRKQLDAGVPLEKVRAFVDDVFRRNKLPEFDWEPYLTPKAGAS